MGENLYVDSGEERTHITNLTHMFASIDKVQVITDAFHVHSFIIR